jgi:hypothetical protein
MPIGAYEAHLDLNNSSTPEWFNELLSVWNTMETVSISEIRKQSNKRKPEFLQKAFHFGPEDIPNKFGDLSTNYHQTWLRNVITGWLEAKGLVSTEHFHISFIEQDPTDYRKPETPRICYIWRCWSEGIRMDVHRASLVPTI